MSPRGGMLVSPKMSPARFPMQTEEDLDSKLSMLRDQLSQVDRWMLRNNVLQLTRSYAYLRSNQIRSSCSRT